MANFSADEYFVCIGYNMSLISAVLFNSTLVSYFSRPVRGRI